MENLPIRNSTIRNQFRSARSRVLAVRAGRYRKKLLLQASWAGIRAALTCGNEGKRDAADTGQYQRRAQGRSSTKSVHSEVENNVSWEFDNRHQDEVGELVAVYGYRSERESIEHERDGDPVCSCWLSLQERQNLVERADLIF